MALYELTGERERGIVNVWPCYPTLLHVSISMSGHGCALIFMLLFLISADAWMILHLLLPNLQDRCTLIVAARWRGIILHTIIISKKETNVAELLKVASHLYLVFHITMEEKP